MTDFTPFELKQLKELNKALLQTTDLTQEQLNARIDGMPLELVIEDAISHGAPVSKAECQK